MKFEILSAVETTVLKTMVSAGEDPISVADLDKVTGYTARTIYNAVISMTAVGILDQIRINPTGRGRPTTAYTITDLGIEVLGTNTKVLEHAARRSLHLAIS